MRIPVSARRSAPGDRAPVKGTQRTEQLGRLGRAYRAGQLVCNCVHVTISLDDRLGLTEHERHLVRVRFHEPVADELRRDLIELVRRRGSASDRAAERIDPIELVVDDPLGERQRMIGRLQPPQARHGHLREIDFALDSLSPTR